MGKKTSHGTIPTANATILVLAICILLSVFSGFVSSFSIELTRIDHIESSLFPKNITLEERHERLARISEARVLHFSSNRSSVSISSAVNTPIWRLETTAYFTRVHIGSRHFEALLMLDSGTDDTFVQCHGCIECFPVKGENFDPKSSFTYQYLPCDHPLCVPRMCRRDICFYKNDFYDNVTTEGIVGTDTFMFSTRDGTPKLIRGTAFGCGIKNSKDFFRKFNDLAGHFGLGSGKRSFLMQYESITNGVFSYCLPPSDAPRESKTYLQFGNEARIVGDARTRAQTVRLMPGSHYEVELVGISVGNNQLHIEPRFLNGGIIIDTGSTNSALMEGAYLKLRAEVMNYLKQHYGWNPLRPPSEVYDLCYKKTMSANITLPSLTFHFNGAALQVGGMHAFMQRSYGRLCLAMLRKPNGPNVLGAFQQVNHRFVFDVKAREMTFLAEDCVRNS